MTGSFELFQAEDGCFRFRTVAPDGTVMALSTDFPNKRAAVAGIEAVREYAGMGLITDQCPNVPFHGRGTDKHRNTSTKAPGPLTQPEPAARPAGQTGIHTIRTPYAPHTTVQPLLPGAAKCTTEPTRKIGRVTA
jgi:uncharacterized protein YegP (UPF0339 family)